MKRPILAVLLVALAESCGTRDGTTENAAPPPLRVRVARAHRGDITAALEVTGEVEGLRVVRLASPVAGRVTFLVARPGDHVAAGDIVARVVPLESEAALQGFAMLEGAGALDPGERRTIAGIRRQIADIPLRAPFSAVVADRARNPGEQVAPGDVVLELFDPLAFYVLAQVPLGVSGKVRPGMKVEIDGTGIRDTGRVVAPLAVLGQPTLTVPMRVSLRKAPTPPLLHVPVRCRIVTARHQHALLIPRPALLDSSAAGRGVVMVAAGGVAVRTPVRLGLTTDTEVEVRRGLAEGDAVIVEGGYGLPNRAPVESLPGTP